MRPAVQDQGQRLTRTQPGPGKGGVRGSRALMAALMTIVAMPALDIALVVLVLPGAATSSASGNYGLVLSVYLVGLLATTPLWGAMGDRYGARPLLLLGTALFGIGAAGASLSPASWGLVVSRAIQGVGAGSMQGLT